MTSRSLLLASLLIPLAVLAKPPPASKAASKARGADSYVYLKVGLFSEESRSVPIASVGGEVITLQELVDALAMTHQTRDESAEAVGTKKDYQPILERLIATRLLVLEAKEMELDQTPALKEALANFKAVALRDALKGQVLQDLEPDPKEVERLFEAAVREWKVRSLLFEKEEEAKRAAGLLAAGKSFDEVAREEVAQKRAKGGEAASFVSRDQMLPQVVAAVDALEKGAISPPVRVDSGFVLLTMEDVRYPENAMARAQAERRSLARLEAEALRRFYDGLVDKHAKVNRRLLEAINFDAKKPGFNARLKDKRTLVRLSGGERVTVGDLAEQLAQKYFHGVGGALEKRKINAQKEATLEAFLYKKLFTQEATRRGLPDGQEYKQRVEEYSGSLLFGTFVEKVIVPDVKVTEGDLQAYFAKHADDFTYPTFYRARSLGFAKLTDAQAAVGKLKAGTDFKWLKSNAAGQLPEDERTLELDGELVSDTNLGEDLRRALAGARSGEVRLHASGKHYYLVSIEHVVPSKLQPYEEAREELAKKVYSEKVNEAIQDWAKKLRKAHDVRVFMTRLGS